jgi:hypothetical protein
MWPILILIRTVALLVRGGHDEVQKRTNPEAYRLRKAKEAAERRTGCVGCLGLLIVGVIAVFWLFPWLDKIDERHKYAQQAKSAREWNTQKWTEQRQDLLQKYGCTLGPRTVVAGTLVSVSDSRMPLGYEFYSTAPRKLSIKQIGGKP